MENRSEIKDLEIILRARTVQDWVFRVTSKKPKRPVDEFKEEENNGMPVKYQHSLGTRMQNLTLDILGSLQEARFDKRNRADHLTDTLCAVAQLQECIGLCYRLRIIRKAYAEEGVGILLEVKRMAIAWKNKSV